MPKSNYERNRAIDARYGGGAYVKAATVYVALFTSMPTVAGGGTEVSGGSYARVAVTNDATNFPNAVDGAKSNANPIAFAQATSAWGTVVGGGVYDSLVGGNLLDFASFTTPQTIQSGGQFTLAAGQFTLVET